MLPMPAPHLVSRARLWLFTASIALVTALSGCTGETSAPSSLAELPPEAVATLHLIKQGGPFPYRKDGALFHNREGLLPERPHGHYRAYTVPTPGASTRGARRFVVGGSPPKTYYYTHDHYNSFTRIDPDS